MCWAHRRFPPADDTCSRSGLEVWGHTLRCWELGLEQADLGRHTSPQSRPQCRARGLTVRGKLAGRVSIDLGPGVQLRKERQVPPTPAGPAPSARGLTCPGRSADNCHSSGGLPPQAAVPRASPDLAFPPPRLGTGPTWLTHTSSCWHGRPSARVPPFLGSQAQPASPPPVHLPGPFPGLLCTSVCHSASDCVSLCLSSPLSPRPQGVPLSEPAVPPRCPSLPPAQESAATAAAPQSARGSPPTAARVHMRRAAPSPAPAPPPAFCLRSPASPVPRRLQGLPPMPPLPTCSQSPQAGLSSVPPMGPALPSPAGLMDLLIEAPGGYGLLRARTGPAGFVPQTYPSPWAGRDPEGVWNDPQTFSIGIGCQLLQLTEEGPPSMLSGPAESPVGVREAAAGRSGRLLQRGARPSLPRRCGWGTGQAAPAVAPGPGPADSSLPQFLHTHGGGMIRPGAASWGCEDL